MVCANASTGCDANVCCPKIKSDNPTNDAIIDDTAGQAYVEQFALETFQRADRTVQANKVTKYVGLFSVWG
jgi:hypothetical protein